MSVRSTCTVMTLDTVAPTTAVAPISAVD